MTGGAGAGTIAADQVASYSQWPPTSIREPIGTQATLLPTYTATGTPITLSASTPTAYPKGASSTIGPGNGWADPSDTAGWYVTKSGCSYDLPYDGVYAAVPTAAC
jgi:glucan 1,3-beta-glucosidase